jgi:LysR family transcriptional activator of nhaA
VADAWRAAVSAPSIHRGTLDAAATFRPVVSPPEPESVTASHRQAATTTPAAPTAPAAPPPADASRRLGQLGWLNYNHLYYFWVVAREGSVTRATRVLNLAQPTISGQLRALERALGDRLFVRRGRHLALTDTGHVAFRYADEIFSIGRELIETIAGRPAGRPWRFTVGVSDSMPKVTTHRLLAPALALEEPLHLVLRVGRTEQLLADLSIHALDLVLAETPVSPSVHVRAFNHLLGESGITVFATPALATRHRRRFPHSLDDAPLLVQTENAPLRRALDAWLASQGIRPRIVAEVEDVGLLQVFGRAGLGLFAAPTVVEREITSQYGVKVVGRIGEVRERFYAISVERRLKHPAVVAISEAARRELLQG